MPSTEATQLGRTIRGARTRQRLTQTALPAKAGVTREYLARIETGVQEPSLATLRRIARALRVGAADLLR